MHASCVQVFCRGEWVGALLHRRRSGDSHGIHGEESWTRAWKRELEGRRGLKAACGYCPNFGGLLEELHRARERDESRKEGCWFKGRDGGSRSIVYRGCHHCQSSKLGAYPLRREVGYSPTYEVHVSSGSPNSRTFALI